MFVTAKMISENPFIKMRTGVSSPFGVVSKLKGIIHFVGTHFTEYSVASFVLS